MTKAPRGRGDRDDNLLAEYVTADRITGARAPTTSPGHPRVSRSIHWWPFREWLQGWVPEHLERSAPMAGSEAWFLLDDSDPAKWAAVLVAAEHHVLRCETAQEHLAEASRAVSAAADWAAIAQHIRERQEFRREHPWAVRST